MLVKYDNSGTGRDLLECTVYATGKSEFTTIIRLNSVLKSTLGVYLNEVQFISTIAIRPK